jgi:hypothetical protein
MAHDAIVQVMSVVKLLVPLLYGAVFCRSEKPMRRLVAWTRTVSDIAVAVIRSLFQK